MTPDLFTGAWRRMSLHLGDDRPFEPGTVLWFQVGDKFLDIRRPKSEAVLTGPGAVTGTTTHADGHLTWHHELDWPTRDEASLGEDTGAIEWRNGTMIERGEVPTKAGTLRYTEKWVRLEGSVDGPKWSMTPSLGAGLGLRVGQHTAVVYQPDPDDSSRWAAVHLRKSRVGWSPVLRLGDIDTAVSVEHSICAVLDQAGSAAAIATEERWSTRVEHNTLP